jgi:hypothetical protein
METTCHDCGSAIEDVRKDGDLRMCADSHDPEAWQGHLPAMWIGAGCLLYREKTGDLFLKAW